MHLYSSLGCKHCWKCLQQTTYRCEVWPSLHFERTQNSVLFTLLKLCFNSWPLGAYPIQFNVPISMAKNMTLCCNILASPQTSFGVRLSRMTNEPQRTSAGRLAIFPITAKEEGAGVFVISTFPFINFTVPINIYMYK